MKGTAAQGWRAAVVVVGWMAVACCGQAWAGALARLLAEGGEEWPGRLARLRMGPATAGAWSAPAWGDVTADRVPDLVLGSAYGDLVAYPGQGRDALGGPVPLLASDPLPTAVQVLAATPCFADYDGDGRSELLLLLGGRLIAYDVGARGLEGGRELKGSGGGLRELLEAKKAGEAIGLAWLGARRFILLALGDGAVWRVGVSSSGVLAEAEPFEAGGRALRFPEPVRICVGDVDGDGLSELVAGGDGKLYVVELGGVGRVVEARRVTAPDGSPTGWVWPCVRGAGEVLLGTAWGPVMALQVGERRASGARWVMAEEAPLDGGLCAAPWECDWNGDGRTDLVVGCADGHVRLFIASDEGFYEQGTLVRDARGPILGAGERWRACFPAVVDMDGDGDADVLLGEGGGAVRWWRNDGVLVAQGALVELAGGEMAYVAAPWPADWDGDGDVDLLVGVRPQPADWSGREAGTEALWPLVYVENDGGGAGPVALIKAVGVDLLVRRGDVSADGMFLGPLQVCLAGAPAVGAEALCLARSGLFRFRLATRGPDYPRLVLETDVDEPRPWRRRGLVWAIHPRAGSASEVLIGLGPYGFITVAGDVRR